MIWMSSRISKRLQEILQVGEVAVNVAKHIDGSLHLGEHRLRFQHIHEPVDGLSQLLDKRVASLAASPSSGTSLLQMS